jgi:hypothetical protein
MSTDSSNFSIICAFRNEALRVAFIDVVETLRDGKVNTEYYSKLVKADINGKDKVPFFCTFYTLQCFPHSVLLPGFSSFTFHFLATFLYLPLSLVSYLFENGLMVNQFVLNSNNFSHHNCATFASVINLVSRSMCKFSLL